MPNPLIIFNAPISTTGLTVFDTNSTLLGTRPELNLIAGTNITITGSNNATNNRADITISGSSGGGASITFPAPYMYDGTNYYITTPAIKQVTRPVPANFSWITTQGTASVTNINNSLLLATQESNLHIRMYGETIPTTPYTIIADIAYAMIGVQQSWCGLALKGTGTPIITFGPLWSSNQEELNVSQWTSETLFSGNAFNFNNFMRIAFLSLKITDDGTTRVYSFSADGVNFTQVFSELHTAFITPTQIGIFVINSANALMPAQCWLLGASGF